MLAKQVYHTAYRISYRVSDISLKNTANYDIIWLKEGAFMPENKLLDLSFEFAVAVVNLIDGVSAPKSFLYDRSARKSRHLCWGEYTRSTIRTKQKRFHCKVGDSFERIQ